MKTFCKMTTETYSLKEGTKGVYLLLSTDEKSLTEQQYHNITSPETLRFFRRLGGSESAVKCYTSRGYLAYKLTSTSPDRQTKRVRTFNFDC